MFKIEFELEDETRCDGCPCLTHFEDWDRFICGSTCKVLKRGGVKGYAINTLCPAPTPIPSILRPDWCPAKPVKEVKDVDSK